MLGSSRSAPPEDAALSPSHGLSSHRSKNRRGTRYEVQDRLGEGALWIVYRVRPANRSGADASLALKALRGAANRHARLPMSLEAAAVHWNALSHPHLNTPTEWGVESGTLFFTSNLLTGGSLESRLARSPLNGDEAMQLLRSMAGALSYLHSKNGIHGDVRPRQILFDASGSAVLTDGGHAGALADAGLALGDFQPDSALYLAPERSSGSPMTPASDIYSLGATVYAALAGRAPFAGSSALALASRHRHETPPAPSTLNPLVPREFDELVLRLLSKDPEERPSAFELERLLQPRTSVVANPTPSTPEPTPAVPVRVQTHIMEDATPVSPPQPVKATVPKRRPIDDLVQQTLDAQDEATRHKLTKRLKRRHGWREFGGLIGSILCLALLIGGGIQGGLWAYNSVVNQRPKQVRVPKYFNLPQDKAKNVLAKSGLYMKVTRESFDPKVPAGTVMKGDPEPGRDVRAKREVFVTVSAGQAPIKMVDFSDLTLDQARTIILQHGMRLGSIAEQYDEKSPRGAIIGQFPQPGDSFSRAQPITLVVSRGAQPKEIDAQNGEFAQPDPLADAPPAASSAPFDTGDTFAPLESVGGGQPGQTAPNASNLESRSALVRVTMPKSGGTQLVRIIVRDANGERTVYQRAHTSGADFKKKVTVSRASDQRALVRVFIGEELVNEEEL